MAHAPFSDAFREFVRQNIVSVEQIQVLVLLSTDPERRWSTQELSAELSSTPSSILHRLTLLKRRKLVGGDEKTGFHFSAEPTNDALVEELRREFRDRPVSVIGLIFSGSKTLESFSDAFRIGGKDNDR